MKKKNVVTPKMCLCIMDLVKEGASPEKVNNIIHSVGKSLRITVTNNISGRSARRVVGQAEIATQLRAYIESVISGVILSSDGTSHKGLNYESRHAHFLDPDTNEKMTLFLGISLAPGHTSEEQLEGWVRTIDGLYVTYMASPVGQKRQTRILLKVMGMLTDHAADQKKLFALFRELKKRTEREIRGEQAIKMITPDEVLCIALEHSAAAVEAASGLSAWDALSDADCAVRSSEITKAVILQIGEDDFNKLTPGQQAEVDFCVWCGCTMHKDLNAHKGGIAKAITYWEVNHKMPPCSLPNKDNEAAACLGNNVEKARVAKMTSRGGIKTCELMGLLLKHKDSKKGQQDHHGIYLEAREHVGFFAHFPDTSNTWYQSYCDAAAEIIVHLPVYREMLEWIRDEKQTGHFTNIELNIYRALNDIPTLTELAAHALYGQAITYPYLQVARKQGMTHFSLAPLHLNLLDHIQKLICQPKLLYSPDTDYATGSLDGQGWERPEAVYCIMAMAGQLPDLEGVLLFLLEGAFETWKWFSHDVLHREIPAHLLKNLYPPATNDPNESTLGELRQEKFRAPNATLEYSNSKLMLQRNKGTVDYLENNLSDGLNQTFLRKQQRKTERQGLKLKHRKDLALASQKKVANATIYTKKPQTFSSFSVWQTCDKCDKCNHRGCDK
ncbi:uncharacterized protein C8R40DRAFT_1031508 [Lentinula edodes]|uniref:uncharacterized protein n=1 Tax=Lentinula edodes TaxID=5353 RepID=UPI001E8DB97A|nr:uncharacterized protein C8R40DRAFT_1031508 [Lentinula edodes]KAH7881588.1 hypothetical protein C8R40DRAFT_1031508 [Lentinula edodes]